MSRNPKEKATTGQKPKRRLALSARQKDHPKKEAVGAQEPERRLASGTRHADNYGVEIIGFDVITDAVLSSELVLLMEHLKAEITADNYFED